MTKARFRSWRNRRRVAIPALCLLGMLADTVSAQTTSDIVNTKHNLSASGPGIARASTETRVCIFLPHALTTRRR